MSFPSVSSSENRASTLWTTLLTAASTATTFMLACATPFPALAALTSVHMRRHDGMSPAGVTHGTGTGPTRIAAPEAEIERLRDLLASLRQDRADCHDWLRREAS